MKINLTIPAAPHYHYAMCSIDSADLMRALCIAADQLDVSSDEEAATYGLDPATATRTREVLLAVVAALHDEIQFQEA